MTVRAFSAAAATVFLLGCASLDDFKAMSAQERAEIACSTQSDIRSLHSEISGLKTKISASESALAKGYRVHKQCLPAAANDTKKTCRTTSTGSSCTESKSKSYKSECIEIPIPVNHRAERDNIQHWTESIHRLETEKKEKLERCYPRVRELSPEEAYRIYMHS